MKTSGRNITSYNDDRREVRPIADVKTSGRNVSELQRRRRELRPIEDVKTSVGEYDSSYVILRTK